MNYPAEPVADGASRGGALLRAGSRRVLQLALTVALAVLIAALMVRFAPGYGMDERRLEGGWSEPPAAQPAPDAAAPDGVLRYCVHFFSHLCAGDWGDSVAYSRPVRELVVARAPTTLRTVGAGFAGAWLAALAPGFALSLLRRPWCGLSITALTGLLLCVPAAVIALLAVYAEAGPALAVGVILWPRLVVQLRAITGEIARRPHVLAARARGVGRLRLVVVHIWWPALPQVLALAAVMVNHAVGVAVPVETICDSPGLGQMMWQAATARDLPLLVHLTLLVALATATANLAGDVARKALQGAQ